MKILGVDPGIAGAAAVIEIVDGVDGIAPKLVDVIDIPVLGTAAKTRIDAIGLRNWIETHCPNFAGVERAGSMPRQGVASAFKYGRATGTIEAVVACCKIPMVLVEPSKWKRTFHLNSDKEASRQLAIGLFPHAHDQLNLRRHIHGQQQGDAMNAFLEYAEKQTPASVKARQRAAEKRRVTKAEEKALAEREDLFRLWKKWRRERLETLLAGPHGGAAQELVTFLKVMTLDDRTRLVEFVRAAGWAHTDADTKFEVLSLINATITALRERAGLPPIDDMLPDEKPTAFLLIWELFR